MKSATEQRLAAAATIAGLFGVLAIPIGLLEAASSSRLGIISAFLATFRGAALVAVLTAACGAAVSLGLRLLRGPGSGPDESPRLAAAFLASGVMVLIFLLIFERFPDPFEAVVAAEVLGGVAALIIGRLFFVYWRRRALSKPPLALSPRAALVGAVLFAVLWALTFLGPRRAGGPEHGRGGPARPGSPNVLLIVLDSVRADHLSLYGYGRPTTPFLENMASEGAVFTNAFAPAPWTLPSHASLFTGLYPSRHNAHAEHMWLDDSFRTLAEVLDDHGYETVCFSNNDYVSSYHNLVQGFERTWYKGDWTDDPRRSPLRLERAAASFGDWLWSNLKRRLLARIVKNPASLWVAPDASQTRRAVVDWLDRGRDGRRPFFVFINLMDAHLPYNPPETKARQFLSPSELEASYAERLRFPPLEYCLDVAKGRYTESEVRIINGLYDACLSSLDAELEALMTQLRKRGLDRETLIIITSDHGEYLGERNRFAHGLGLHDELLHVPLIIKYEPLFRPNSRESEVVSLVDVPGTILAAASVEERTEETSETRRLFDLKSDARSVVFGEFRVPVHLLVNASLRADNSAYCVEQKTARSRTRQLIWKSRGEGEFYNVVDDPKEVDNLYSRAGDAAAELERALKLWMSTLAAPAVKPTPTEPSERESARLKERLRALGYIR